MIPSNPLVSIITVVYNGELHLQEAIDSVINQSYSNIEYVVVDGCSVDDTINIIQKNVDVIANWISEPDDGIYFAMNKGLSMVNGDIIGILNADDILYPFAVERVVEALSARPLGGYTCAPIDLINKSGTVYGRSIPLPFRDRFSRRYIEMPCSHQSVFVTKNVYQQYGVFDTQFKLSADYELILRFMSNGIFCSDLDEPLGAFRLGGESASLKSPLDTFMVHKKFNVPIVQRYFYLFRSCMAKIFMGIFGPRLFNFIRGSRNSKYSYNVN